MSETHEIELRGCTPEPLMSYLKALGILRLVSEQADPEATGCWRNDVFVIVSRFDEDRLAEFFLMDYQPTPIIGPWAGDSGFFKKDNKSKAVDAIADSKSPRLANFRKVIEHVRKILKEEDVSEKPEGGVKERLLRRYRREMPDPFVQWMDAAMALQAEGQAFAPVLGTGGNDGRLDFTQNFMQRLVALKLVDTRPAPESKALLSHSLFGQPTSGLGKAKIGQFAPGRAGGPNATQGMEGDSTDNPWDFVLMLEGTLMLAGSVVRRIGVQSTDKAAFPFTVRTRPVGKASPAEEELADARSGELWLPIWDHFASRAELEVLFAEGRAELSGRPARDAVDFAQAVADLGVDRGIRSFARYGFFKRRGDSYLATAMDRFQVPKHPRETAELIHQFDRWLDRFRRACAAKETPTRLKTALRHIESAIFDYCRYGQRADMLTVLIALGQAERELAVTGGQRGDREICPPFPYLTSQWIDATRDGSVEFDIALATAGIHDREDKIQAIRCNIEPVTFEKGRWVWQEAGPQVVWNSTDLPANMAAVLARRMMDSARAGCENLPLDSRCSVSLETIARFLAEEVDDRRIEDLLWGLVLLNHRQRYPETLPRPKVEYVSPLPREYALLKLLFLPRPLVREWKEEQQRWRWRLARDGEKGVKIRAESRILPLLRSGRVADACRIAYRRLQSSGLKPLPGVWRASDWGPDSWIDPRRLAAALLLPVSFSSVNHLVHLVTRQNEEPETATLFTEGGAE